MMPLSRCRSAPKAMPGLSHVPVAKAQAGDRVRQPSDTNNLRYLESNFAVEIPYDARANDVLDHLVGNLLKSTLQLRPHSQRNAASNSLNLSFQSSFGETLPFC